MDEDYVKRWCVGKEIQWLKRAKENDVIATYNSYNAVGRDPKHALENLIIIYQKYSPKDRSRQQRLAE